jgi:segregation and condensation protein B
MDDLKNIIESLIFVSDGPLTVDQIKTVLPGSDPKKIRITLDTLIQEYETAPRGFYLREIAGGVQFRTRPEYKEYAAALLRSTPYKLSKAGLETLAIIAYKQPIIRADIEQIRGVDCGGVLRMLMERKLVRVLGRREIPGRPLIYATTKKFLEVFDLKNLKDLPTPKEIEDLESDSADKEEDAFETVTVVQASPSRPTMDGTTETVNGNMPATSSNQAVDSDGDKEMTPPRESSSFDSGQEPEPGSNE